MGYSKPFKTSAQYKTCFPAPLLQPSCSRCQSRSLLKPFVFCAQVLKLSLTTEKMSKLGDYRSINLVCLWTGQASTYTVIVHRKKKVREFPVSSRDVTTKLSLGGNNVVITELFLPRGSLVSDIPPGDGKLVKTFFTVYTVTNRHNEFPS